MRSLTRSLTLGISCVHIENIEHGNRGELKTTQ